MIEARIAEEPKKRPETTAAFHGMRQLMPPKENPSFYAVSRKQWLLVGVLGAALVAVVVSNLGGRSGTGGTNRGARLEPAHARRDSASAGSAGPTSGVGCDGEPAVAAWPIAKLAHVLRHNPFGVPRGFLTQPVENEEPADRREQEALPQPPGERAEDQAGVQEALDRLAGRRISAIVGSRARGYLAIIDSKTVRPGDVIDGFQVIAVEPDGVVLAPPPMD
jgi:hypothetical protein